MAALKLKNVTATTIQPYEKSEHPATLVASLLDLNAVDVYIPLVLFYRAKDQEQTTPALQEKLVGRLKDSLSKVLVPYYPFAGRWVKTYDERVRELQCNDEGVPFIEASVDEELDSVLNDGAFRPDPQLGSLQLFGLDSSTSYQKSELPLPSLLIQVTKFKCGGVVLNVQFAHLTVDGQGMVTFLTAWSQIAMQGETSIMPVHDRSLIFSRGAFMNLVAASFGQQPSEKEEPNDSLTASSDSDDSIDLNTTDTPIISTEEVPKADPAVLHMFPRLAEPVSRIFHVKRSAIESLKREAAQENLTVTTVDLITAHIWRSFNHLPEAQKKKLAVVASYVNGRQRFHRPSLPDHYSGNVINLAFTPQIPSAELLSHSHVYAADLVHTSVQAVNPLTWKSYMVDTAKMLMSFDQLDYTQYHLSSWLRFPVYDVSFDSSFGNPVYTAWNFSSGYLPLGLGTIMPPPPQYSEHTIASIQFSLDETNGVADALFSDSLFLSMFHSLK